MPIVDIEVVAEADDALPAGEDLQTLADRLGETFDSGEGETWVRSRRLPRDQYAENGGSVPADIEPVFVTVGLAALPEGEELQSMTESVAETVGEVLGRESTYVHVEYPPPLGGRMAFGGTRWA